MAQQPEPNPLDVALMDEIEAAWNYFTGLPKGHYKRIHVIEEFSTPWEGIVDYIICYRFRGKGKKCRRQGFTPRMAKESAIVAILRDTGLNISEAPIPSHLPQCAEEKIRDRRRKEIPKEERGRGEGNDYPIEYEDELIMEEVESWKPKPTASPELVELSDSD